MKSSNTLTSAPESKLDSILTSFKLVVVLLAVMWGVYIVNLFLPASLDLRQLGIVPRELYGLKGVIFSPFLHANILHIISNTLPFIVLGTLVAVRGWKTFSLILIYLMLVGGVAVWCFARQANHIGASGLVFGFFGFLLAAGWFERKWQSIIIAIFVALTYGTMIFGVLPTKPYISFEAHIFGFLAGVSCAFFFKNKHVEKR